ncbi:MAG: hypothetical protein P4M11_05405 [Candidatus Pacebacteria bacterium]|nr:hypothetical protein [Candidatus Paceibacterota bacterium]
MRIVEMNLTLDGEAFERPYLIGTPTFSTTIYAVMWRAPRDDQPHWSSVWPTAAKSSFLGQGQLTSRGRDLILEHFKLDFIKRKFPMDELINMTPRALAIRRRKWEIELSARQKHMPRSDNPHDRISALFVI